MKPTNTVLGELRVKSGIYLVVFLCAIGDVITTYLNMIPRNVHWVTESYVSSSGFAGTMTHQVYATGDEANLLVTLTGSVFAPLLVAAILGFALLVIGRLPVAWRSDFKNLLRAGLVLVALSPVLNNLAVLLGVRVF